MMRMLSRGAAVVVVSCLLAGGSEVARADERPNPGVRSVQALYSHEVTVTVVVDHVKRCSQQRWIGLVVGRTFAPYLDAALVSHRYTARTQRLRLLYRWPGRYTEDVAARVNQLRRTRPWYRVYAGDKTVTNVVIVIPTEGVGTAGVIALDQALPEYATDRTEMFLWPWGVATHYSVFITIRRKLSQAELNDVAAAIQLAVYTRPSRLKFMKRHEPIG